MVEYREPFNEEKLLLALHECVRFQAPREDLIEIMKSALDIVSAARDSLNTGRIDRFRIRRAFEDFDSKEINAAANNKKNEANLLGVRALHEPD